MMDEYDWDVVITIGPIVITAIVVLVIVWYLDKKSEISQDG